MRTGHSVALHVRTQRPTTVEEIEGAQAYHVRGMASGEVVAPLTAGTMTGDEIAIDVELRTVDLNVDEAELAVRRRLAGPWKVADEKGWLSIYAQTVQPLSRGAVLFRKSRYLP